MQFNWIFDYLIHFLFLWHECSKVSNNCTFLVAQEMVYLLLQICLFCLPLRYIHLSVYSVGLAFQAYISESIHLYSFFHFKWPSNAPKIIWFMSVLHFSSTKWQGEVETSHFNSNRLTHNHISFKLYTHPWESY